MIKIYTFDQNGGRLNAEVETINGIIKSGDEIDVPVEDILHVNIKRVDEARTTVLVVGVILTIIVAAIAIVRAAKAAASPSKF